MIPFRVELRPGISIHEQIVYAAKRAMVAGRLAPGSPFPSVRTLSRELKVNPNTAHKVISTLIADGLLETRLGVGTVVTARPRGSASERSELLGQEIEQLVVEAKRLGISVEDVKTAIATHWKNLSTSNGSTQQLKPGERKRL